MDILPLRAYRVTNQLRERQATRTIYLTHKAMQERNLCSQVIDINFIQIEQKIIFLSPYLCFVGRTDSFINRSNSSIDILLPKCRDPNRFLSN